MSVRKLCVAAALVVGSVAVPANAAQGVCVETLSIEFSPRLTLEASDGTATFDSERTCTYGTQSQRFTAPYTGNCLLASFSGGGATVSVLVGGALHVGIQAGLGTERVTALIPDQVCNTGVASGVGVMTEFV